MYTLYTDMHGSSTYIQNIVKSFEGWFMTVVKVVNTK